MPGLSIIIINYKSWLVLEKCIKSIWSQKTKSIEIIIIDIKDKYDRCKWIINKKNIGAGYSRNIGIKHSRGKYIAFLDSDDFWNRKKLDIHINYMKKNY